MSKAGCPYDNAPMERYFNTFKSELIHQHNFRSDMELDSATEEYVFYGTTISDRMITTMISHLLKLIH